MTGSTGLSRLKPDGRWRRITPVGALALLLIGTAAAAAQGTVPAEPTAAQGDFAGLIDIGGRRLYLECRGTGSPTVILEAGYRSPATVWSDDLLQPERPRTMVLEGVAAATRVCLYERPGTAAVLDGSLRTRLAQIGSRILN